MDSVIDINTLFGPLPAASSDLTLEALRSLMETHSIQSACTLSTLGLLLDPGVGNAATRAACEEDPALLPVATLNPTLYFAPAEDLTLLKTEGFRFIRFFPEFQGWPLDFAPFRALLQQIDSLHLPIMIGVNHRGDISTLERVLSDYTGAVILSNVSVHLLAEATAVLGLHPEWYIETSRLLAPGCLHLLVDIVGPQRLLFGTGAPGQPVASALNALRHADLSPDTERRILADNAQRLLGI